ncbi:DUF6882 domain-containing protein [Propionicicella superfundia]|uniref:DUF6882 domain-containing protein n=1 Tax=Propionicicella superfundia TaxID=348582 RepID=UPI00042A6A21|nr:DUF6882 domain-containing protein [Propionicicella superfundia]
MNDSLTLHLSSEGDPIRQLADQVMILATEAQEVFAERYGAYAWRADLSEPAVFWFEREPPAIFRPSFVGSVSGYSNTWLWGWENINGYPDAVVDLASRTRAVGEQVGSVELTTAQLPLDADARKADGLAEREAPPHDYVLAAMAVSGLRAPVFYRAPTGDDSYAWFVLDNPEEFDLPAPSVLQLATLIPRLLQAGLLDDHRLAVRAYATRRPGLSIVEDGETVTLTAPDGALTATFDELGRLTNLSVRAAASQAAPEREPVSRTETEPKARGLFSRRRRGKENPDRP